MATKRKSKSESSGGFFLFSIRFWGHTFIKFFIAALVVAAGWAGLAVARNRAIKLPDFHVSPSTLTFTSKPAWATGRIEEQMRRVPDAESRISLLDGQASRKVAATLQANPWVKDVKSVVREFPDRIRARVELREPVALVQRSGGRYYLVDAAGTRLPGEYTSPKDSGLDLLMVVYVRTAPPAAGKTWPDAAVVEGAKVAAFLRKYDDVVKAARITAIDTTNIGGRLTPRQAEISLVTMDQTRIYWGKGLETIAGKELAPASKIENLRLVLEQEGTLANKEYVDIRFPNPVFRPRGYALGSL